MRPADADHSLTGQRAVRLYLRELTAEARGPVALTLVLTLAVAATEGLGLVLLFPLLEMAGVSGTSGAVGEIARGLASRLQLVGRSAAPVLLIVYGIVMTGRALLVRWSVIACVRLQERFLLARRRRLFHAILASRWQAVLGQRAGALTHSLTAELEATADAPSHLLSMVTAALLAVVYLAVALRLSVTITLLSALAGAGLLLVLERSRRKARRTGQEVHRQTTELFAAAAEEIDGLKTTKAFAAEGRSDQRFAERSSAVASANERSERLFADARALLDAGAVVLLALAVYIALSATDLGAAGILVLLYLFARLTPRLAGLQSAYQRFTLAMPPFLRVTQAIDDLEKSAEGAARGERALRLRHALVVRDVRYSYPPGAAAEGDARALRTPALHGVTLTIAAGKTTAVVGASGAGKSTLAELVLGLLLPDSGRVEIDRVELTAARARSWRSRVGYVGQDTSLFNDSIRANLRLARPEATDEEIFAALSLAAADGFVSALPNGLDTVVGEKGYSLSCGERQRLALARALLRRPRLLILDEATSAVDSENEQTIQQAVESLRGRMTVLVITHRLATVRTADVIYVMDRGRVIEQGTFPTLLGRNERFAALCRAQRAIPFASVLRLPRAR